MPIISPWLRTNATVDVTHKCEVYVLCIMYFALTRFCTMDRDTVRSLIWPDSSKPHFDIYIHASS